MNPSWFVSSTAHNVDDGNGTGREAGSACMSRERSIGPPARGRGWRGEETCRQSGLTVLVIDDLQPIRAILRRALEKQGHTVFTTAGGAEGLEIHRDQHIDLVVCDLAMPGMNGYAVACRMKEQSTARGAPRTPFILVTGWGGDIADQAHLAEFGIDALVEKPFELQDFLDIARELTAARVA